MEIRRAEPDEVEECVGVLRALPDYFTESTHDEVREAWGTDDAVVAVVGGRIVGFVTVSRRYPHAAEIMFAAVELEHRDRGIGTALVEQAVDDQRRRGARIVEVKTLDGSEPYEPYVATRAFWERRGFVQIDCIDPYPGWAPGNPAALYVRAIAP